MDAYIILEKKTQNPIDEDGFNQLKGKFKQDYLSSKNFNERIELHRNPYEVKNEVLHELYSYLQKIGNRNEMRDVDNEKKSFGYVSTKIKETWEADKRLETYFDAIKKYCELRSQDFNIIAVHMAEYSAMSELADQISEDIHKADSNKPLIENQHASHINVWNILKAEKQLQDAFEQNSELLLLETLKNNSFFFYELYDRKFSIQPMFHEINLGAKLRCDFAWLNDNSDGPEWVLVEVEKPRMRLFSKNGKPTSELNSAIEQVKSWDRYFKENPSEKRRIFGAVSRFRYLLIAGTNESWSTEKAIKWRAHNNAETNIEIRSTDIFIRALKLLKSSSQGFWSFEENPSSTPFASLENYWQNYGYMDSMRKIFT